MRFRTGGDGDYHWEDGDLATCSWKVLTTCTCHGDEREREIELSGCSQRYHAVEWGERASVQRDESETDLCLKTCYSSQPEYLTFC